jgi:hypothetical protein
MAPETRPDYGRYRGHTTNQNGEKHMTTDLTTAVSYRAEVLADQSGTWAGNALRFATRAEAEHYAADLASRWLLVTATRVVASTDPVTDRIIDGRLERLAG